MTILLSIEKLASISSLLKSWSQERYYKASDMLINNDFSKLKSSIHYIPNLKKKIVSFSDQTKISTIPSRNDMLLEDLFWSKHDCDLFNRQALYEMKKCKNKYNCKSIQEIMNLLYQPDSTLTPDSIKKRSVRSSATLHDVAVEEFDDDDVLVNIVKEIDEELALISSTPVVSVPVNVTTSSSVISSGSQTNQEIKQSDSNTVWLKQSVSAKNRNDILDSSSLSLSPSTYSKSAQILSFFKKHTAWLLWFILCFSHFDHLVSSLSSVTTTTTKIPTLTLSTSAGTSSPVSKDHTVIEAAHINHFDNNLIASVFFYTLHRNDSNNSNSSNGNINSSIDNVNGVSQ